MPAPSAWDLLRCFGRTYCINAAYNPRGLQNIGQIFALDPLLARIHGEGEALREARARHVGHANCHPFLVPALTGMLLHMETAVAEKRLQPHIFMQFKDATANTLSAIGDSLYNGSLAGLWALICACLILEHLYTAAVCFTLVLFLGLQAVRFAGFMLGFRRGMGLLTLLRRIGLIEWAERVKMANAVLTALFLHLSLRGSPAAVQAGTALVLLLVCRYFAATRIPRVIIACGLILSMIGLARLDFIPTLDAFMLP